MNLVLPEEENPEVMASAAAEMAGRTGGLAQEPAAVGAEAPATAVLLRETMERLRQSEGCYQALVEWSPESIAVQRRGKIVYVNPAAIRMMGADSASQLLGKPIIDLIHPDFRAIVLERLKNAAENGGALPLIEEKLLRLDGATIDVQVQGTMIEYGGEPALYGSMRDVTKIRAAEEKLRQNRALLSMSSRIGRLGAWSVELPAGEVTFSEEAREIFELLPDHTPTLEATFDFYLPEQRAAIAESIGNCIRDAAPFDVELQIATAKGRPKWVRSIGEAERGPDGAIQRVHGAFQDISERKASEAHTLEQAALIDKANDAIVVRDLDDRIIFWSKGAERLYGWTTQEAVGRVIHQLSQPTSEIFSNAQATVLQDGVWTGEINHITKSGGTVTVASRWTLVKDSLGGPESILTIATDITERKKIEAQFLRAQRLESIGTLAGGIAHDLNNILAPISMGAELLRQFGPEAKMVPIIDAIEKSANRGAALVRQVLTFARGVEGSRVPVQVRDVLEEIRSIAENTFPKNITLGITVAADLWPVQGDPTQLNQVLLNLSLNARDAMPDGGRLDIVAANFEIDRQFAVVNQGVSPGRYVVVSVTDSGTGIPKEIIDRIFEPFFTTKALSKGTGLGLSTAIGIVQGHHGVLNVYSELGKGTQFKVYLPANLPSAGDAPLVPSAGKLPRGNGELILVVDDEASILSLTSQMLQAFGYRVVTADDGAHAVGIYATNRREIAAVITDMMMPIMSGAALVGALRRINPEVVVIAASGLNANLNASRMGNAGVKHFLAKPFSADTLLQLLQLALAEAKAAVPAGQA